MAKPQPQNITSLLDSTKAKIQPITQSPLAQHEFHIFNLTNPNPKNSFFNTSSTHPNSKKNSLNFQAICHDRFPKTIEILTMDGDKDYGCRLDGIGAGGWAWNQSSKNRCEITYFL
jgi:hypothetical protein